MGKAKDNNDAKCQYDFIDLILTFEHFKLKGLTNDGIVVFQPKNVESYFLTEHELVKYNRPQADKTAGEYIKIIKLRDIKEVSFDKEIQDGIHIGCLKITTNGSDIVLKYVENPEFYCNKINEACERLKDESRNDHNYKLTSWAAYIRGKQFLDVATGLNDQHPCPLVPTVVNGAFSCELFLKSIILKEQDVFKSSHHLSKLYDQLGGRAQNFIKTNSKITDWEHFFKESDNAFVEWRYLHEKKGLKWISINELLSFSNTAKIYLEDNYNYGDK